ncbi:hypothetical protein D1093_04400 [Bartonella kosoyi]|uniref:Uncharacterized protein n=3 Tax=Bartonella TaxID=773 RepID=A0A5B9CX42_9HYPH|nr:hypothetical protein D1093_03085 [Bartonella kosoyi]QEE08885.1 hypothetical protein D1093_04400 [Bartonella kosoyi]
MRGKPLTQEEEVQTLQDCNRLQTLLSRQVTVEHIGAAAYLLSGLKIPANTDSDVIALNYSIALADASEHALKRAVKDVIRGEAKGLSKTFMPTGAELADYCRNLKADLLSEASVVKLYLTSPNRTAK